jgi:hypothetical protein
MKVMVKAVALGVGLLLAVLAAGCGTPAASGPARGSVPACTAFGVRAIEQRLTPARLPPACQGLSRAEVNFALGRAIYLIAGSGRHKTAWRRAARVAGARLGRLISGLPPSATSSPAASGGTSRAARPAPVNRRPLGLATLLAWLVTIGMGAVLLGRQPVRGVLRQVRARRGRTRLAVLAGHFGLASTGLLVWACYLATGWLTLAWAAVCLLLPVIGLGMAVLTMGTAAASRPAGGAGQYSGPGADTLPSVPPASAPVPAVSMPAASVPTASPVPGPVAAGSLPPGPVASGPVSPARPRAGGWRQGAILPTVHGLAAMATILLAVLTALGAG